MIPLLLALDTTPVPVERPAIVRDFIPYGATRKRQMANYSWRHYKQRTWQLTQPRAIVLHYTVSDGWRSPWNWFASNTPGPGPAGSAPESPGGCTHFLVAKNGKIIQLVPLTTMCRHAIGLNHRSIGIEFVEMRSARNVLNRRPQMRAGAALVRWLQARDGIATRDVIGHGMVNDSPYFQERVRGWRNDHADWNAAEVRAFRRHL